MNAVETNTVVRHNGEQAFDSTVSQYAKAVLQHQPFQQSLDLISDAQRSGAEFEAKVQRVLASIPSMHRQALIDADTVGKRCQATAQLFGDEFELRFWTVFEHYLPIHKQMQKAGVGLLRKNKTQPVDIRRLAGGASPSEQQQQRPQQQQQPSADPADGAPSSSAATGADGTPITKEERLPACFGLLCDADELRAQQLHSLEVHNSCKLDSTDSRRMTERHVLLGTYQLCPDMLITFN